MSQFFLLAIIFSLYWLWRDSLNAREVAMRAGKEACRRQQVQFLDDTVSITKIRLCRDALGQVRIKRFYVFDISTCGADRLRGYVKLCGNRLEDVLLDLHNEI